VPLFIYFFIYYARSSKKTHTGKHTEPNTLPQCRSGLVVSAPDCGVKGQRFESHRGPRRAHRECHYNMQSWARAAHLYCKSASGSLNRVPASAGIRAGMSALHVAGNTM